MKSSFSQEDLESMLESYLNEFYHQRIVPLEKAIMKLGGDIDNIGDSIDIHLERFVPKDPFIERIKKPHYWENENSDYYKFFKSLFEECFEREWLKISPHYNYEDTLNYWMSIFGCVNMAKNELTLVIKKDKPNVVSPIEWFGQKSLCVYLIVSLQERYVTTTKRNKLIKSHFLPNSDINTIANTKSKLQYKKPSKSSEIDELLFELTSRLD